jgi:hypothetical protein
MFHLIMHCVKNNGTKRQKHCDQCQRNDPGSVWQIIRTVATSSMCHVSIVWRKSNGDDLNVGTNAGW